MKKTKLWLGMLLICLALAVVLPAKADAAAAITASGTCGDNLTWSLTEDGTLTISGMGAMKNWTAPDKSIPWSDYRSVIETVVIEEGVTSIGNYAFSGCDALVRVVYLGSEEQWGKISIGVQNAPLQNAKFIFAAQLMTHLENIVCDRALTRLEFAKILAAASHLPLDPNKTPSFTDCGGLTDQEKQILAALEETGWYLGYEDGSFHPSGKITRAEIAAILYRYDSGDNKGKFVNIYADYTVFRDVPSTHWYAGYVNYCANAGYIPVGPDEKFYGNDWATLYAVLCWMGNAQQEVEKASCGPTLRWELSQDGVLTIGGRGAMYDYDQMTAPWDDVKDQIVRVVLCDGVTGIGNRAFVDCSALTLVEIPASMSWIGTSAFGRCSALETVIYHGSGAEWSNITIGSGNSALNEVQMVYILASGTCGDNLTWSLTEDGTLTISGEGAMWDYWESWHYSQERYITSAPWGIYYDRITSIVIGDSVTSIGDYAFCNCDALTSVEIGDSVTSIGEGAFRYCDALTSVVIGDSVTSIGYEAFCDCTSLTSVEIGDSVTSIGEGAFRYCDALTSVEIGDSVTTIGDYAFSDCYALMSVEIGDSVTSIGGRAFSDCYALMSVEIGDSVTSIGSYAFSDCYALMSVEIGDSVTSIGSYAFYNCYRSLTSVVIGDSVTSIGYWAFYNCAALTNVFYRGSAEDWAAITIGSSNYALTGATRYYHVAASGIAGNLLWVVLQDGGLIICGTGEIPDFKKGSTPWYAYRDTITDVTIDRSVTAIGDYAFMGLTALTRAIIPNGVTAIGANAFENCSALQEVVILGDVSEIGASAFKGCGSLGTVSYLGTAAKWNQITIDSGNDALTAAKRVYLAAAGICGNSLWWMLSRTGVLTIGGRGEMYHYGIYDWNDFAPWYEYRTDVTEVIVEPGVGTIGNAAFHNLDAMTDFVIPDGVVSIGNYAFYYCDALTDVEIPDSVTIIGYSAFEECAALTSIEIPDSVTSIGSSAFWDCSALASVKLGKSVETIGEGAFRYCSALTSIAIPDSVRSIGDYAFYNTALASVTLGKSVETIGVSAFEGCAALTNIVIPDSVTSIGAYAFSYCEALTGVTIGKSVETIGMYAFSGCSSLVSVRIPEGMLVLSEGMFSDCTSLEQVVLPITIDTIEPNAFTGCENLTTVCFPGSEEEWDTVWIRTPNDELKAAEIVCNWTPSRVLEKGEDGIWRCYEDGYLATNFTGFVKHVNGKYYFVNKGVVKKSTGFVKHVNGKYYYIQNGVKTDINGFVKHTNGKYYYVKNGMMVDTTGLVKHTNGKYYYIVKGVKQDDFTGLVKHTNGKYYYVQKGLMRDDYTGLAKHTNKKFYYVEKGVWTKVTALVLHSNGKLYYVKDGIHDNTYNGTAKDLNGKSYKVVKGIAQP